VMGSIEGKRAPLHPERSSSASPFPITAVMGSIEGGKPAACPS